MEEFSLMMKEYESPGNFDKLIKVKNKIEDTKAIVHQSIEKLLERGEQLEDLVQKSEELSKTSKFFYTESKKLNRCCIVQ